MCKPSRRKYHRNVAAAPGKPSTANQEAHYPIGVVAVSSMTPNGRSSYDMVIGHASRTRRHIPA